MKEISDYLFFYNILLLFLVCDSEPLPQELPKQVKSKILQEVYENECGKFHLTDKKVQNYINECNYTYSGETLPKYELGSYLCLGVINNIILSCVEKRFDVVEFLSGKNFSKFKNIYLEKFVCPVETLDTSKFLVQNEIFDILKKTMGKNEDNGCDFLCYDVKSNVVEDCKYWFQTNAILKALSENRDKNLNVKPNVKKVAEPSPSENIAPSQNNDKSIPIASPQAENLSPQSTASKQNVIEQGKKNQTDFSSGNKEKKQEDLGQHQDLEVQQPVPQKISQKTENISHQSATVNNKSTNSIPVKGSSSLDSHKNEDPEVHAPAVPPENLAVGNQPSIDDTPSLDIESTTYNEINDDLNVKNAISPENVGEANDENFDEGVPVPNSPIKEDVFYSKNSPSEESSKFEAKSIPYNDFIPAEDSHFFIYFLTSASIVILGYVAFHNKNKILAYALEGRRSRNSRRRPNSASYRKLECSLEEAITSNSAHSSVTNVVY